MRCPTHILFCSALLAGLSAAEAQNAPATSPPPGAAATPNAASPAANAASPAPSAASPAQTAASPAPSAPSSLVLYFDAGSATVRQQDTALLDQASRLYRAGNPIVMIVTGSADATGSAAANLTLSQQRANSVLRGLVSRGIPVERFQVIAKGQTDPVVPDAPGTAEERNRRVEITWR
jgi:outer membrane protein OmpA-like peptidoglycan-associated protein